MGKFRDLFFNIFANDKSAPGFGSAKKNIMGLDRAAMRLNDRFQRMGRGMVNLGGAASVATAGMLYAFRDSLALYDEQARVQAKVEQGIKSTGKAAGFSAPELFEMASGLQAMTRFGDEAILGGVTAQLLTFTNIAGSEFRRAQVAALDLATTLDGDLQSASIMIGKALNDPVRGLTAMSRAGVTFSDDQAKVIKALAETGKIAEAQGLILDELAKQYGGQAEAAARVGLGQADQLANVWGDAKEEIGAIIAELLPPIVSFFRTLIDGFRALPEPVKKFSVAAAGITAVVGPLVAILGLLVTGLAAVSAPVLAVVGGITALTAAIVAFWPEIKKMAGVVADAIGSVVDWVGGAFVSAWTGAVDIVTGAVGGITSAVQAVYGAFASVFTEIPAIVWDMVEKVGSYLKDKLISHFEFVTSAIDKVKAGFWSLWNDVVGNSYVPDMVDEIGVQFDRLDSEMVQPGLAATGAVNDQFKGLFSDVTGSISQMAKTGTLSFRGFADALLQAGQNLADRMLNDVFDRIAADMSASLSGVNGGGAGVLSGGGGGLGSILGGIGSALFKGLPGFNEGTSYTAGGRAGVDRNITMFRHTAGEQVTVTPKGAPAPAGRPVIVNIQTPNPAAFQASRAQVGAQIGRAVAAGQRGQ